MLTVWSVCNGTKYRDSDVHTLRRMVASNLERPHRFRCLSDREIPGIDCLIPDENWPGWWSKLLLFRYSHGQVLYLDLDVVVVGNLDRLLSRELAVPANWAQSGHGGCQSSVMSWDTRRHDLGYLADLFRPELLEAPANGNCGAYGKHKLWGDQEYLTDILGSPGEGITPMRHVYSYKYHCRESLPGDASVVCFHGAPKPEQVHDEWVIKSRLSTATEG